MRKIFFIILIFCFVFVFFTSPSAPKIAEAKNYPYAKIEKPNVGFYSVAADIKENIKFYVEQSYFVMLLENKRDGFYKAQYIDEIGYVKATDLTFVEGTPNNPYPTNISFRIFSLNGLNLRSSPIESQGPFNIITTVPYLENNLMYYGKVNGEEAVSYKGDIWYYSKYLINNSQTQPKGYLYSVFCDLMTLIPINAENLTIIDEPIFEVEQIPPQTDLFASLPESLQIIVILSVSLPCLIIIYFLFKPTKISIDIGKRKKKKVRKLRNSDYYELED